MSRMIRKETIENVSKHFTRLQEAVTNAQAEEKSLAAGIAAGNLTSEGMRDGMARIIRYQTVAAESGQYLGNLCGAFLSEIATKSPARMAEVFKVLQPDLPNIVEAVNEKKAETREQAEQRKREEITARANELLAKLADAQAKKAQK